jgi:hypothetical protein
MGALPEYYALGNSLGRGFFVGKELGTKK